MFEAALGKDCAHGTFFAPRLFEIANLDAVCDAVNRTGYGLTLGIHSRIDTTAEFVSERVWVGNLYVNRDMIGAVVGVPSDECESAPGDLDARAKRVHPSNIKLSS